MHSTQFRAVHLELLDLPPPSWHLLAPYLKLEKSGHEPLEPLSSELSIPKLLPGLCVFCRSRSSLARAPRLPLFLLPPLEFTVPFKSPRRNWSRCRPPVGAQQ